VFAGRTTRTMPVAVYNMLTFESFAFHFRLKRTSFGV
jgi:hypothetical protein